MGSNDLRKSNAQEEIVSGIFNIIDNCYHYGVKNVYVSGLTYRKDFPNMVSDVNSFFRTRQAVNDFVFINNDNILPMHIWKDNIHLNNKGNAILENNFVNYLNKKHIT